MKKNNIFSIIMASALLIIAFSVAYYFISYIPREKKKTMFLQFYKECEKQTSDNCFQAKKIGIECAEEWLAKKENKPLTLTYKECADKKMVMFGYK